MNDEMEEFEKRLGGQPLRKVPMEWRAKILAAAQEGQEPKGVPAARRQSFGSGLMGRLAAVFWPHPVAWAGLAGIWILIFAVDFSGQDPTPVRAENSAPPTREMMAQLKQQRQMLAELIGARDSNDADRAKTSAPRPRTERMEILMT